MLKNWWKQNKIVFFSFFLWGLLAHGFMIFQKISLHDDLANIVQPNMQVNMITGRWGSVIVQFLDEKIYGFVGYSTPTFYGFLMFFTLAVLSIILIKMYHVDQTWMKILLPGLVICSPVVLAAFGYIYSTEYTSIGFLLTGFGCYLICTERPRVWKSILGIAFICFAVGIYQAFFSLALAMLSLHLLNLTESSIRWKQFFKRLLYYLGSALSAIVIYFVLTKLSLIVSGREMLDYKGLDTMGQLPLTEYLGRIPQAYKEFFFPTAQTDYTQYVFNTRYLYIALIVLSMISLVADLIKQWKKGKKYVVQMLIAFVMFPLAVFSLLVFTDPKYLTTLHMYPQFILMVFILQRIDRLTEMAKPKLGKVVEILSIVILSLMCMMFARFDNECYVKMRIVESQVTQYYTTLITRIENVEGYNDELPIVCVNDRWKEDGNINEAIPYWDELTEISPYNADMLDTINDYAWKNSLIIWNGFWPDYILDSAEIKENPAIEQMPCYPDEGSIKVIDGMIVVKFQ